MKTPPELDRITDAVLAYLAAEERQVLANFYLETPYTWIEEQRELRCPHCGALVADEGCSNGLCEAVN